MGRLTRDPELKTTASGVAVCTITLAVERDYAPAGAQREADFINVVNWRQGAEFVSRYFRKGQLVAAEGRLQSRKWTDSSGNNRVSWEIQADRCYFAERTERASSGSAQAPAAAAPSPSVYAQPAATSTPHAGFDAIRQEAANVQMELVDDRGFYDPDDDVPF